MSRGRTDATAPPGQAGRRPTPTSGGARRRGHRAPGPSPRDPEGGTRSQWLPDGRKTRQDDQRERFPATTAATRRAEERYGAGHQEEPTDVADVDRRRQRPALDGPLGDGRKSVHNVGRARSWRGTGRSIQPRSRRRSRRTQVDSRRGVGVHGTRRKGTREMTVSDGPRRYMDSTESTVLAPLRTRTRRTKTPVATHQLRTDAHPGTVGRAMSMGKAGRPTRSGRGRPFLPDHED